MNDLGSRFEATGGQSAPVLAEWEDADVQRAYEILCDPLEFKPMEEHWEGYCARWIVYELVLPLRERIAALEKERKP